MRGHAVPRPHRSLALALALPAACVIAIALTTTLKTEGTAVYADPGWDRHLYRAMAERNPLTFGIAPFNHRILVPCVARLLPGSLQSGFMVTTFIAAWVSGVMAFLLVRTKTRDNRLRAAGVLLFFSLGWGAKFAIADFWIPDATVLAFTVAALYFAVRRSPLVLGAVLLVGVLAKESVIFVLPLYFTLNAARGRNRRLAIETALVGLPSVIALVTLRLVIPDQNGNWGYLATMPTVIRRFPELYPEYNYGDLLHDVAYRQRYRMRDWATVRSYTIEPFGLVTFAFIAAGWRSTRRPLARLAPFLVLVYVQLLFATDTQRLLCLAAPAVCWLAVIGAQDVCRRGWSHPLAVLAAGVFAFALVLVDADRYTVPAWWQIGPLLVAATPIAIRLFRRRGGATSTNRTSTEEQTPAA